jgi:hypothetical protein
MASVLAVIRVTLSLHHTQSVNVPPVSIATRMGRRFYLTRNGNPNTHAAEKQRGPDRFRIEASFTEGPQSLRCLFAMDSIQKPKRSSPEKEGTRRSDRRPERASRTQWSSRRAQTTPRPRSGPQA